MAAGKESGQSGRSSLRDGVYSNASGDLKHASVRSLADGQACMVCPLVGGRRTFATGDPQRAPVADLLIGVPGSFRGRGGLLSRRLGFAITIATCLVAGCVTDHGAMTLLSSKNVELSRVDLKHVHFTRNLEASDGRFWFLFIPFGRAPTIGRAVDECLVTGRGDFMTSARVTSLWWTAILFSWESYRVLGDVGDSLGEGAREVEGVAPEVSGGGGRNPWPQESDSAVGPSEARSQ